MSPLGVTVYDCILCIVYKHGYYAEIPLDKLSKMIIKMIGEQVGEEPKGCRASGALLL